MENNDMAATVSLQREIINLISQFESKTSFRVGSIKVERDNKNTFQSIGLNVSRQGSLFSTNNRDCHD